MMGDAATRVNQLLVVSGGTSLRNEGRGFRRRTTLFAALRDVPPREGRFTPAHGD